MKANMGRKIISIFVVATMLSVTIFAYVSYANHQKISISAKKKGKLQLSTNKSLYNLTNVLPGVTSTSCVTITYSGKKAGQVKTYLNKKLGGDSNYINLIINQGQYVAPKKKKKSKKKTKVKIPKTTSCLNYKKKSRIYNGSLNKFSLKYNNYKKGLKLKNIKKKSKWSNKNTVSYQFIIKVSEAAPQRLTTTSHKFIWQTK